MHGGTGEQSIGAARRAPLRPVDLAQEADFHVGEIRVTPPLRMITGPAGTRTIEPKMMQVLVTLAKVQDSILSRDDLIELCWDGRIVGDNSINRIISLLRTALREAGADSVTIETVPKVGYRLRQQSDDETAKIGGKEDAGGSGLWPIKTRTLMLGTVALALLAAIFLFAGNQWRAADPQAGPKRIVMLASPDQGGDDGFLERGILEEFRTRIGRLDGVSITHGESTERLQASGLSAREIGSRMGADFVLITDLSVEDDRMAVEGRLVKSGSGEAVWEETFASTPDKMGTLPGRIARAVADGINRPMSTSSDGEVLSGGEYRLFMIANGIVRSRDYEQYSTAVAIMETLTETHPDFGPGLALYAGALAFQGYGSQSPGRSEALDRARKLLDRARATGSDAAIIYSKAGWLARQPEDAQKFLEKAIEVDSGDAQTFWWLGHVYSQMKDFDAAADAYAKVAELDPLWVHTDNAIARIAGMGRTEQAIALYRNVAAAAVEDWQKLSAEARIALISGDRSAHLELIQRSAETASQESLRWSAIKTAAAIAYLRGPMPSFQTEFAFGQTTLPLLTGQLPPLSVYMPAASSDIWDDNNIGHLAPALFIKSGRSDELLRLFDTGFPGGDRILPLGGITSKNVGYAATPYIIMALRDSGRTDDASRLLADARSYMNLAADSVAPMEFLLVQSKLETLAGNPEKAVAILKAVRLQGWPHVSDPFAMQGILSLAEDPAFQSLSDNAQFRAIHREIEAERGKERREAQRAGLI